MAAHAKYAPSASERWITCPGSVRLCEGMPERTSTWAAAGIEAHELLKVCLENRCWRAAEGWVKHFYKAHEPIDVDACDSVQVVLDYVAEITAHPDAQLLIEHRVKIPSRNAPDEVFGTLDIAVYVPFIQTLFIIDFKHGAGVPVEIEYNTQLLMYALGEVRNLGTSACEDAYLSDWHVATVIIQPRCHHKDGIIREQWYTADYVLDQFALWVDEKIAETQHPNAPLVPGDVQCRWCPANIKCPAREAFALSKIGQQFAGVREVTVQSLPEPEKLDLYRLATILQASSFLKAWLKDCEAAAIDLVKRGQDVPGFKLVWAKTMRQWHLDPVKTAESIIRLTGCDWDDIYPRQLINITAAEKLLKNAYKARQVGGSAKAAAAQANKDFAYFTTKQPTGAIALVPETDSRQAINRAQGFELVQLPDRSGANDDDNDT